MDKYITATALSERWCCSKSRISKFRKEGVLKSFRPFGGRKLLFLLEEVEAYEQRKTDTGIEISAVLSPNKEWGHLI